MIVVKWLVNIFKALNSNQHPLEIAEGVGFGILLALVPSNNLLWFGVFFLSFFLSINQAIMMVIIAIGKLFVPFVDPFLEGMGYLVLTVPALEDFYDWFFNLPLIPLLRLHNTIVMGAFAMGVLLYFPILFIIVRVVRYYRQVIRQKIIESAWFKAFTSSPIIAALINLYKSASGVYNKVKSS